MYGNDRARKLVSPPFEVESYLNQNMQAADWIAAIIGKLWAREILPEQYLDYDTFNSYFWERIHGIATHSTVVRRDQKSPGLFSTSTRKLIQTTALENAFKRAKDAEIN